MIKAPGMRKHHWVSQVGFTMTEILIAMAIVGLLAAIALPAYQQSTRKANRADAKITMARLATLQERFFFQNNAYAEDFSEIVGGLSLGDTVTSDEGHYEISLAMTGGGTGWIMTATALGGQGEDLVCESLIQSSLGAKTALDSNGDASTECW